MEELLKKPVKRDFNYLGGSLVLSQILIAIAVNLVMIIQMQVLRLQFPKESVQGLWDIASESGIMLIVSAIVGMIPPLLLGMKKRRLDHLADVTTPFYPRHFVKYMLLIFGLQILSVMVVLPVVTVIENAGFSYAEAEEVASAMGTTGTMLFYSIAVAPICEELVYRGAVLRYLERYGKLFAIVISALLFALMHGNIVQFPNAFTIGILLGYIALKYSLQASILLHIGNNLFIESIARMELVNAGLSQTIDSMVSSFAMIFTVALLVFGFSAIRRWIKENKTQPHVFRWFFTSWTFLLLIAGLVYLTASSLNFLG